MKPLVTALAACCAAIALASCSGGNPATPEQRDPAESIAPLGPAPAATGGEAGQQETASSAPTAEGSAAATSPHERARAALSGAAILLGIPGQSSESALTSYVLIPPPEDALTGAGEGTEQGGQAGTQDRASASPVATRPDEQLTDVVTLLTDLNAWTLSLGDDPGMDEVASTLGYDSAWKKARAAGLQVNGIVSPAGIEEGFDAADPAAWTLVEVKTRAGAYCLVDLDLFDSAALTPKQAELASLVRPAYAGLTGDCSTMASALYDPV